MTAVRPSLMLCLGLAVCLWHAAAEAAPIFFEIRRDAHVYAEASRDSAKVTTIKLAEHDGIYTVRLLEEPKRNGYYKVRLPHGSLEGWIYQSFVRVLPTSVRAATRAYKRSLYRHWIDEDGDCQNTRVEVLVRDSTQSALKFAGTRDCSVTRGRWVDPYSGEAFTEPRALDVDHFVPLKNAHDSGAWAWTAEKRRQYANYLVHKQHLLAVKASENRRKGDKGPDRYLPPRAEYRCEYVQIWVKIKTDWELEIPAAEQRAIDQIRAAC